MWGKSLAVIVGIIAIITMSYMALTSGFAKVGTLSGAVAFEEAEDDSGGNWSVFV